MSQLIDNLKAAADAEVANSNTLKSKLDAAVTANAALTAQNTQLASDLQTALANGLSDADKQTIQDVIQKLTDSTAVNNPAN